MRTRLDQLDRLAADLANVDTTGYKGTRMTDVEADRPFATTLQSAIDVTTADPRLDMQTGTVTPTGRSLDLAIDGNGFFVLDTARGQRYTRNGHFKTNVDGTLVTADGDAVLGDDGKPIQLGKGDVTVANDGTIRSGATVAGKLQVVEFATPANLVQESGAILRADNMTPTPVQDVAVQSGALEASNVSVVERIAQLTDMSRSFEALQKALSVLMNDIDGRAIDQLGRR
jgi:flagellar basal body rod protein FlgG